jgi:hypothetical protein
MSWTRFQFLLARAPAIFSIARELWLLINSGPEAAFDEYLTDLKSVVEIAHAAKTEDEKHEAARRFADLIARL